MICYILGIHELKTLKQNKLQKWTISKKIKKSMTTLGLTATSFRCARPLSSSFLVFVCFLHACDKEGRKRKGWEGWLNSCKITCIENILCPKKVLKTRLTWKKWKYSYVQNVFKNQKIENILSSKSLKKQA